MNFRTAPLPPPPGSRTPARLRPRVGGAVNGKEGGKPGNRCQGKRPAGCRGNAAAVSPRLHLSLRACAVPLPSTSPRPPPPLPPSSSSLPLGSSAPSPRPPSPRQDRSWAGGAAAAAGEYQNPPHRFFPSCTALRGGRGRRGFGRLTPPVSPLGGAGEGPQPSLLEIQRKGSPLLKRGGSCIRREVACFSAGGDPSPLKEGALPLGSLRGPPYDKGVVSPQEMTGGDPSTLKERGLPLGRLRGAPLLLRTPPCKEGGFPPWNDF